MSNEELDATRVPEPERSVRKEPERAGARVVGDFGYSALRSPECCARRGGARGCKAKSSSSSARVKARTAPRRMFAAYK